jgi:hypothetical protein
MILVGLEIGDLSLDAALQVGDLGIRVLQPVGDRGTEGPIQPAEIGPPPRSAALLVLSSGRLTAPVREGRFPDSIDRQRSDAGPVRPHHEEPRGGEHDVLAVR